MLITFKNNTLLYKKNNFSLKYIAIFDRYNKSIDPFSM